MEEPLDFFRQSVLVEYKKKMQMNSYSRVAYVFMNKLTMNVFAKFEHTHPQWVTMMILDRKSHWFTSYSNKGGYHADLYSLIDAAPRLCDLYSTWSHIEIVRNMSAHMQVNDNYRFEQLIRRHNARLQRLAKERDLENDDATHRVRTALCDYIAHVLKLLKLPRAIPVQHPWTQSIMVFVQLSIHLLDINHSLPRV
jgi:hypothetical protein